MDGNYKGDKMKKLLFVDFVHHYGGAQKSTVEMISRLKKCNYEVEVVDFVGNKKFRADIESIGVKFHTIGINCNFRANTLPVFLLSYCKCLIFFYKVYRRLKPDYIWTNSYKTSIIFFLLRQLVVCDILYFFRGVQLDYNYSLIQKIVYNCTFDKILVQSNKIKKYIKSQGIKLKICVVPNVLSNSFIEKKYIKIYDDSDANIIKLVFVGTLLKTKGITELFESLNSIVNIDKVNNIRLSLAGEFLDMMYKKKIEKYIEANKISNYVLFLGWVEDVGSLIYNSDILVLPSYAEGIPRVVMEAMSLGKCVVVSDVGGVSDVVSTYENGILIPPKNYVALEHAINFLIASPKSREQIGRSAKKEMLSKYTERNQIEFLKEAFN